ncbi:hypothetical protein [Parachlamydia sp. AcF125]|uniref:hypothetical protein n=1 Tax=Parachlamydia sp. AcF125 TaxID=2795736 RepID=UPI001BCA0175|nr:hypothetical protein [Parachlamydia sp. AcF125]MBS4168546.1 hypothetical protein [Parachlamydia sp. AcF125]
MQVSQNSPYFYQNSFQFNHPSHIKISTLDKQEREVDSEVLEQLGILKDLLIMDSEEAKSCEVSLNFEVKVIDFVLAYSEKRIAFAKEKISDVDFSLLLHNQAAKEASLLPEIYQFACVYSVDHLQKALLSMRLEDNLLDEHCLQLLKNIVDSEEGDINQRKFACYLLSVLLSQSQPELVKNLFYHFLPEPTLDNAKETFDNITEIFTWLMGNEKTKLPARLNCLYLFFEVLNEKEILKLSPTFLFALKDALPQLFEMSLVLPTHAIMSLATHIKDPFLAIKLFEILDISFNLEKVHFNEILDWGSLILKSNDAEMIFICQESVIASFAFQAMAPHFPLDRLEEIVKAFYECIVSIERKGTLTEHKGTISPRTAFLRQKRVPISDPYIVNCAFHTIGSTFKLMLNSTRDPLEWLEHLKKLLHLYSKFKNFILGKNGNPYFLFNKGFLYTLTNLALSPEDITHQEFLKEFAKLLADYQLIDPEYASYCIDIYENSFPAFVQDIRKLWKKGSLNLSIEFSQKPELEQNLQKFELPVVEKIIAHLRQNQMDTAVGMLREEEKLKGQQGPFDKILFRANLLEEILKNENGFAYALEFIKNFGKKTRGLFLETVMNALPYKQDSQAESRIEFFSNLWRGIEPFNDTKLKQKFYKQLINYAVKQPVKMNLEIANKFLLHCQEFKDLQSFPSNLFKLLESLITQGQLEENPLPIFTFVKGFSFILHMNPKKDCWLKEVKDCLLPSIIVSHVLLEEEGEKKMLDYFSHLRPNLSVLYLLNKMVPLVNYPKSSEKFIPFLNKIVFQHIEEWTKHWQALKTPFHKKKFEANSQHLYTLLFNENLKKLRHSEEGEARENYLNVAKKLFLQVTLESKIQFLRTIFALYPLEITRTFVLDFCRHASNQLKLAEVASLATFLGERALTHIYAESEALFQFEFQEFSLPFLTALKESGYHQEFLNYILSRNVTFKQYACIHNMLARSPKKSLARDKRKFESGEEERASSDDLALNQIVLSGKMQLKKRKSEQP